MRTELYWIEGPWPGRLAIMPRPRGGDWLADEIQAWRRSGVDVIVSLLTNEEQIDLELVEEEERCRTVGIEFLSFSIEDRSVPASRADFSKLLTVVVERLASGKNVAIHCRQGIGRAALVAIGVLIQAGVDLEAALSRVGAARGCSVPETTGQRQWLDVFARSFVASQSK